MKQQDLRKILVSIYECASAWDNDDGKMAEVNEKTPEDILQEVLEYNRQEIIEEILKLCEDLRPQKPYPNANNNYQSELDDDEKVLDQTISSIISELKSKVG